MSRSRLFRFVLGTCWQTAATWTRQIPKTFPSPRNQSCVATTLGAVKLSCSEDPWRAIALGRSRGDHRYEWDWFRQGESMHRRGADRDADAPTDGGLRILFGQIPAQMQCISEGKNG